MASTREEVIFFFFVSMRESVANSSEPLQHFGHTEKGENLGWKLDGCAKNHEQAEVGVVVHETSGKRKSAGVVTGTKTCKKGPTRAGLN